MIRRPPRSTLDRSSAASDVYKRQGPEMNWSRRIHLNSRKKSKHLSLIHISEPTRQAEISYAVFCLKKKKKTNKTTNPHPTHTNDKHNTPQQPAPPHPTH